MPMAAPQCYIVAATPRTGSYSLCEGLGATGVAGRPTEFFNPVSISALSKRWQLHNDVSFDDYFLAAKQHGSTLNGVFGFKIHWFQLENLATAAGISGQPEQVLERLFPAAKFVNVVRRYRLGQAMSYYRAMATEEWWLIDGYNAGWPRPPVPTFNAAAILSCVVDLARQQHAWDRYFTTRGISCLTVEYEALATDYRAEVGRVLAFLGLDESAAKLIPQSRFLRQADEATLHWRKQLEVSVLDLAERLRKR
jgi:LPS sulfotransferase NodH